MPSFQHLTIILSTLPFTLTLPSGGPQRPGSNVLEELTSKLNGFSVEQVYNPNFSVDDGPAAWKKAAAKYTQPGSALAPAPVKSNKVSSGNGNVLLAGPGDTSTTAIDSSDLEYLTPIIVGGKNYLINLDTGSSNFWLSGNKTAAKNKYNPSGPPTQGSSWYASYGDGSAASGDVFKETVVIGGTTATAVAVGHATTAPASFFYPGSNGQPGADGLLGLGFSRDNTFRPKEKTWFDTAVDQGLPNVFAANLMPGLVPGSFDFGQLNKSSYSGEINYVDVVIDQPSTTNHYWMVAPTKGDTGVMDTGTTLILLSHNTTSTYYSSPAALAAGARYVQESNQAYWAFYCNSTLPDFSIHLGGNEAVVPGNFLNYSVLSKDELC